VWWSRQPILFEQGSVRWDSSQSGSEGEEVASGVEERAGECGGSETIVYENHANDSRVTRCDDGIAPTLSGRMGTGGGNVPLVMATGQANAEIGEDICPSLSCAHEQPIFIGKET